MQKSLFPIFRKIKSSFITGNGVVTKCLVTTSSCDHIFTECLPFQPIIRQSLYNLETYGLKWSLLHNTWPDVEYEIPYWLVQLTRRLLAKDSRKRSTLSMLTWSEAVITDTLLSYELPIPQFHWESFRPLIAARRFEAFLNSPSLSTHKIISIFFIASGVGLSPLYCGHFWPIVPAPDDRTGWLWSNWCNKDWQGKPKNSEKTCPSSTFSTTNPTWPDPGSNPGRRGGKPATNRLSYGAASQQQCL
jgi:hypothetical protein